MGFVYFFVAGVKKSLISLLQFLLENWMDLSKQSDLHVTEVAFVHPCVCLSCCVDVCACARGTRGCLISLCCWGAACSLAL